MVLKLSKKVRFLQFCADLSKKRYLIDLSNLKLTLSPSISKVDTISGKLLKNNPLLNQRGEGKNYYLKNYDLKEDVLIAQNIGSC